MGIIYKATNKINGKIYIGQTIFSLDKRKRTHFLLSEKDKPKLYFHRAIKKYGFENFIWEIIEECEDNLLNDMEQFYIKKYKTYSKSKKDNGYNLTEGGDNYFGASGEHYYLNQMSPIQKEKWLDENRRGQNNPNYNNHILKGENHFLNKMTPNEREKWLNENLRGNNNYQKHLSKDELKAKCHINQMSVEEKEKWVQNNLKGDNNPFKKKYLENPEKYKEIYKQRGLRDRGKPKKKGCKKYVITFPNQIEYGIIGLKIFITKMRQKGFKINIGRLTSMATGKLIPTKKDQYICRYYNEKTDKHLKILDFYQK